MIDETIITELSKRHGYYNFNALIEYMQNSGYTYQDRGLRGPLAIATLNGVLLDMSMINRYGDRLVYFIILHETAHMKRIGRMGKETMLSNLSLEDFKEFCNHIFVEEIFADRYACVLFYHFNKHRYYWSETQQLNLKQRQEQYEPIARMYYGKIQNDENKYNEMIKHFIIE
ncbi:MAG: hypothetical protein E6R13_07415 [Spirochaetes bacterium]|nr:MAG: hypothetical protein E6R13_07415 [Spirochaetota bacterium]